MLRLTKEDINSLRQRLIVVRDQGASYFAQVQLRSWDIRDEESRSEAEALRVSITSLSVDIAGAARGSALLAEADMQDLRRNTRQMLANLRLNRYRETGLYIHHDEDVVLGVDPPSHDEWPFVEAVEAKDSFAAATSGILDLVDLLSPTDAVQSPSPGGSGYRPNTAFIMMAIDDSKPELEDVKNGIKDVCEDFGIHAITADEIEHEDAITDRILEEIAAREFLIADLTHERPNVYYEIGYAHAQTRRVILFRKAGTPLHFDLAHRQCPEYDNTTDLKRRLRKRLESITNKRGLVRTAG